MGERSMLTARARLRFFSQEIPVTPTRQSFSIVEYDGADRLILFLLQGSFEKLSVCVSVQAERSDGSIGRGDLIRKSKKYRRHAQLVQEDLYEIFIISAVKLKKVARCFSRSIMGPRGVTRFNRDFR